MKRITVHTTPQAYDVVVGAPIAQLPKAFSAMAASGTKVGVISDSGVPVHYRQDFLRGLRDFGYTVFETTVPSGEGSKTLRQAERLYTFCSRSGLERQSWLIALGGGVVGDLTGFVAATYLRGIPFVQVPTTLLAQVDASIGGKTAVDIAGGKNLVGVFYQPRLVWVDPSTLKSLPKEHLQNGMAEIIKYGAIADAKLFDLLESQMEKLLKGPSIELTAIIARCIAIKARVVSKDTQETLGLRAILNFGHSVGHAIEAATGYKTYLHGQAIAIGMFVAAFLSQQLTGMDPLDRIRLGTLLTTAGLPLTARKRIPREAIMNYLSRDKKVKDGVVQFVLLERLGKAKAGFRVSPEFLDMALSASNL